jgi:hypothetical protein
MTTHQDIVYALGFEGATLLVNGEGTITGVINVGAIQLDIANGIENAEGQIGWNSTDGALEVGLPGGTVQLQVGQEVLIRAKNGNASPLANGTPVYISSGVGANAVVDKADNSSIATMTSVGLTTETIAAGQFGYVNSFGLVRDVNTSAYAVGATLWLGTAGTFVATRPTAPSFSVVLGVVLRSHATEGVVFSKVDIVPRLRGLSDVYSPTTPNDGDIIKWVAANSRWEVGPAT